MAPMVMECDVDGCQFATKELEPTVAVELLKLHDKNSHTQITGIDQTQLLEASLDTGHQEGC